MEESGLWTQSPESGMQVPVTVHQRVSCSFLWSSCRWVVVAMAVAVVGGPSVFELLTRSTLHDDH